MSESKPWVCALLKPSLGTFIFFLHLPMQNTGDSYFHCLPSRGLNLLVSISGNIPPSVYLDSKIKIRAEFKHRDTQGLRFAAENTWEHFGNIKSFSFSCKHVMGKRLRYRVWLKNVFPEHFSRGWVRAWASSWGSFLPGMYSFGCILSWNAFEPSGDLKKGVHCICAIISDVGKLRGGQGAGPPT